MRLLMVQLLCQLLQPMKWMPCNVISRSTGTTTHNLGILFGGTATITSIAYLATFSNAPTVVPVVSKVKIYNSSYFNFID